jgi:hypothetical protein
MLLESSTYRLARYLLFSLAKRSKGDAEHQILRDPDGGGGRDGG